MYINPQLQLPADILYNGNTWAPWNFSFLTTTMNSQGGDPAMTPQAGYYLHIYEDGVLVKSLDVTDTTYFGPRPDWPPEGGVPYRMWLEQSWFTPGKTYTYAVDAGAFVNPFDPTDVSEALTFGQGPIWTGVESNAYQLSLDHFPNLYDLPVRNVSTESLGSLTLQTYDATGIHGNIYIRDQTGAVVDTINTFADSSRVSLVGTTLTFTPNVDWKYSTSYFITTDQDFFDSRYGGTFGLNPPNTSTALRSWFSIRTEADPNATDTPTVDLLIAQTRVAVSEFSYGYFTEAFRATGSAITDPQMHYEAGWNLRYKLDIASSFEIGSKYYTLIEKPILITPVQGQLYGFGSDYDDDMVGTSTIMEIGEILRLFQQTPEKDMDIYVFGANVNGAKYSVQGLIQAGFAAWEGLWYAYAPEIGTDILRAGAGNDYLFSEGGSDELYGEEGNDVLTTGRNNNYGAMLAANGVDVSWDRVIMAGGVGDDAYYVGNQRDTVVENAGEGFDIVFCTAMGGYSFNHPGDAAQEIEVIAGNCTLLPEGFTGRYLPNLWISAKEIRALNGKGTSLADAIASYEMTLVMDAGGGDDLVVSGGGNDQVKGGEGNDIIQTNGGNDVVSADNGNDVIVGGHGAGDDIYNGGRGVDTVKYTSALAGIVVDLSAATNQARSSLPSDAAGIGTDQLFDIENVVGGRFADVLVGNATANRLEGREGDDRIIGNAGNDFLDGGVGADHLEGGTGNDTYLIDDAGDVIVEAGKGGTDTALVAIVAAGGSYTLGAEVERAIVTGAGGVGLVGNALANTLTGNGAGNVLEGGLGKDTLIGGFGDDTYVVNLTSKGALEDKLTELPGQGTDTLDLRGAIALTKAATLTLAANLENLDARGTGGSWLNLSGNAFANQILGNDHANVITGGGAGDSMDGGYGSDVYLFASIADYAGDAITDTGSGPGDLDEIRYAANAAGTLVLLDNLQGVERVAIGTGTGVTAVATGKAAINVDASAVGHGLTIAGNSGANSIIGTAFADDLLGNAGNDVLFGGGGDDRISGGLGSDGLAGGAGSDSFIFNTSLKGGIDTILDFNAGEDLVVLDHTIFAALAPGELAGDAFAFGPAATDAADRMIYDDASGALLYDADGSGAGTAVQIATLATGLELFSNNFFII